jgi:hypothetical protein
MMEDYHISPAIVIVGFIIILVPISVILAAVFQEQDDKVITVLEKFDVPDESRKYLIVDTDKEVYTTNSQLFDTLVEGRTYLIHTRGFRMYAMGLYPEITKVTQSTSLKTNSCYLEGTANRT